jgi:hypothetical protein
MEISKSFKLPDPSSNKRNFDVSNKEDIKEFAFFLKNSKWKTPCPFVLEFPFLSIPDMVKDKLINAYITSMLSSRK